MTEDSSDAWPENVDEPVSDVASVPLKFGYTLRDLNRLAAVTVHTSFRYHSWGFDERVEMAWSGMAEFLYSCEEAPTPNELMRAATVAMGKEIDARLRSHGYDTHDRWKGETTRSYERYWFGSGTVPSPENQIVDRIAAQQIWERLTPTAKEIITTKAQFGDNGVAADVLGKSRNTFTSALGKARRQFKVHWHEGEIPSRPWIHDKTRNPNPTGPRNSITYVLRKRKRDAAAGKVRTPPTRKGPTRKPIAISTDELRRRYESGESIRAIAKALGERPELIRGHMMDAGIERRSFSEAAELRHRRKDGG